MTDAPPDPFVVAETARGACLEVLADLSTPAWRERGLDGTVQIGSTSYPAALAVEIVSLELLVHGWDIADATGRSLHVDAGIPAHLLARTRELVTADRRARLRRGSARGSSRPSTRPSRRVHRS